MGTQISVLWRREARSIEDRARQLEQLEAELEALPPGPDRDAAAAWIDRGSEAARARFHGPGRRASEDRTRARRRRRSGGDQESILAVDASLGMLEVLEGHFDEGLERMEATARAGKAAGYGSIGVTTFRNAALFAARGLRYEQARVFLAEGQAYAETHRAVTLRAHDERPVLDRRLGRRRLGRRGIDRAPDDRRPDRWTRRGDGRQRARVRRAWVGAISSGAERELDIALEAGEASGWLEMILPPLWGLAETAVLRGDPVRAIGLCSGRLRSGPGRP